MNPKILREAALGPPPDAELERTWLSEAARRARELDSREVEAIPAEEVWQKARSLLR